MVNQSHRRQIEAPLSTDKEWEEVIIKEIDRISDTLDNPDICVHCTTITLNELFEELKILGVLSR